MKISIFQWMSLSRESIDTYVPFYITFFFYFFDVIEIAFFGVFQFRFTAFVKLLLDVGLGGTFI